MQLFYYKQTKQIRVYVTSAGSQVPRNS